MSVPFAMFWILSRGNVDQAVVDYREGDEMAASGTAFEHIQRSLSSFSTSFPMLGPTALSWLGSRRESN